MMNTQPVGKPNPAYTVQKTRNTKTQRRYCLQERGLSRIKNSLNVLMKKKCTEVYLNVIFKKYEIQIADSKLGQHRLGYEGNNQ
jgi:uncharacterized protein YceH (UPF0502 family)